ncbi:unnamed protein product [Parnassius apollo]|uniref:(apollo) hypothetical protein n=1 Tax=Parnassius apollo TaxID=110799 RepID=A0A8S3X7Q2_PARAO|nr:unnamed protein product [Parnassius apollo]
MARCARALPAVFLQINLLLMMYAGAGLATAARLKWDPSTYIALREVLPNEYRVAAVLLVVGSVVLLLQGHLALLALYARRARFLLLLTYAVLMACAVGGETAFAWWTGTRVAAWARSAQAHELRRALQLREHLLPLLQHLATWHPLPQHIHDIIKEAEADVPRNSYVALAAVALLALLQPVGAALALLLAARARLSAPGANYSDESETRPLRTVYKNGRLVML